MKKIIQLALLTVLSIFSSAFAQDNKAAWQAQPIIIDGVATDWATNPRYFNAKARVQYEFRNDAGNLYVILKINDRATQMQLMQFGFAVRFKVKSETGLTASIAFPALKEGTMHSLKNNMSEGTGILVEKLAKKPEMITKDSAYLEGFLFTNDAIASENKDEKSICFAKSENRAESIYEIRIPFCELFGNEYATADIITIPIQLQVTINGGSSGSGKRSFRRMGGSMHDRNREGEMPGGGMSRNGLTGGGDEEMGEFSSMERNEMPTTASTPKKSFNIDFNLSKGK